MLPVLLILHVFSRTAILTFLAVLPTEEMVLFLYFIFRGILPKSNLLRLGYQEHILAENKNQMLDNSKTSLLIWYSKIKELVSSVTVVEISTVVKERQIGFLNMFEHLIRVLGHAVADHINEFGIMIVLMIASGTKARNSENNDSLLPDNDVSDNESDNELADETFKSRKCSADAIKIRKLSILRLSGNLSILNI